MDFENNMSHSSSQFKCCECDCSCSLVNGPFSGTFLRSVKRKHDECDDTTLKTVFPQTARVEVHDECVALREMVCSQQLTIQELRMELDEERNAACSAADEAMSMILRLQREKAEIQMEFRQFKRFIEEKMAHEQQELAAMENLLYRREQVIQSLVCDVQINKHRIMGFTEANAEALADKDCGRLSWNDNKPEMLDGDFEFTPANYPVIKCFNHDRGDYGVDNEVVDVEEHVAGEIPLSQDQLRYLECRIKQLEKSPGISNPDGEFYEDDIIEKVTIGSSATFLATNEGMDGKLVAESLESGGSLSKISVSEAHECSNVKEINNVTEVEDEDDSVASDRVYTIDSIHQGAPYNGVTNPKTSAEICDDYYTTTPRDSLNYRNMENPDIVKLYARLQSLEADRESMRQTIISMQTEKAQLVLLKEIAQRLYNDMSPARRARRAPVRKPSIFSFISVFKWMIPRFFWRTRERRCRHMFGMSGNYPGLPILLEKGPRVGQWRCLTSTQV